MQKSPTTAGGIETGDPTILGTERCFRNNIPSCKGRTVELSDNHRINGCLESETICVRSNFYIPRNTSYDVFHDYDFSLSSEQNYHDPLAPFVGKYKDERSRLDYSYHKRYSMDRQYLHDKLIDRFLKTTVRDTSKNLECEKPLENWIIFTAGPMGAGKGHTIQWLHEQDLFQLGAFVNVDPDAIRSLLPEIAAYNRIDPNTAGFLTQKEVGYISEVLSHDALNKGKNVLVDGSLRNAHWYLQYFQDLRAQFPKLKICILHVTARPETVLARARKRALVTGRVVPEELILDSMRSIPESLRILCPQADFFVNFINEDEYPEPFLSYCCMQQHSPAAESVDRVQFEMLWCIRGRTIAPRSSAADASQCSSSSSSSSEAIEEDNAIAPLVDVVDQHLDEAVFTAVAAPLISPRSTITAAATANQATAVDVSSEVQPADGDCPCEHLSECEFHKITEYLLYDFEAHRRLTPDKSAATAAAVHCAFPNIAEEPLEAVPNYPGSRIGTWKDRFRSALEMQCALPDYCFAADALDADASLADPAAATSGTGAAAVAASDRIAEIDFKTAASIISTEKPFSANVVDRRIDSSYIEADSDPVHQQGRHDSSRMSISLPANNQPPTKRSKSGNGDES